MAPKDIRAPQAHAEAREILCTSNQDDQFDDADISENNSFAHRCSIAGKHISSVGNKGGVSELTRLNDWRRPKLRQDELYVSQLNLERGHLPPRKLLDMRQSGNRQRWKRPLVPNSALQVVQWRVEAVYPRLETNIEDQLKDSHFLLGNGIDCVDVKGLFPNVPGRWCGAFAPTHGLEDRVAKALSLHQQQTEELFGGQCKIDSESGHRKRDFHVRGVRENDVLVSEGLLKGLLENATTLSSELLPCEILLLRFPADDERSQVRDGAGCSLLKLRKCESSVIASSDRKFRPEISTEACEFKNGIAGSFPVRPEAADSTKEEYAHAGRQGIFIVQASASAGRQWRRIAALPFVWPPPLVEQQLGEGTISSKNVCPGGYMRKRRSLDQSVLNQSSSGYDCGRSWRSLSPCGCVLGRADESGDLAELAVFLLLLPIVDYRLRCCTEFCSRGLTDSIDSEQLAGNPSSTFMKMQRNDGSCLGNNFCSPWSSQYRPLALDEYPLEVRMAALALRQVSGHPNSTVVLGHAISSIHEFFRRLALLSGYGCKQGRVALHGLYAPAVKLGLALLCTENEYSCLRHITLCDSDMKQVDSDVKDSCGNASKEALNISLPHKEHAQMPDAKHLHLCRGRGLDDDAKSVLNDDLPISMIDGICEGLSACGITGITPVDCAGTKEVMQSGERAEGDGQFKTSTAVLPMTPGNAFISAQQLFTDSFENRELELTRKCSNSRFPQASNERSGRYEKMGKRRHLLWNILPIRQNLSLFAHDCGHSGSWRRFSSGGDYLMRDRVSNDRFRALNLQNKVHPIHSRRNKDLTFEAETPADYSALLLNEAQGRTDAPVASKGIMANCSTHLDHMREAHEILNMVNRFSIRSDGQKAAGGARGCYRTNSSVASAVENDKFVQDEVHLEIDETPSAIESKSIWKRDAIEEQMDDEDKSCIPGRVTIHCNDGSLQRIRYNDDFSVKNDSNICKHPESSCQCSDSMQSGDSQQMHELHNQALYNSQSYPVMQGALFHNPAQQWLHFNRHLAGFLPELEVRSEPLGSPFHSPIDRPWQERHFDYLDLSSAVPISNLLLDQCNETCLQHIREQIFQTNLLQQSVWQDQLFNRQRQQHQLLKQKPQLLVQWRLSFPHGGSISGNKFPDNQRSCLKHNYRKDLTSQRQSGKLEGIDSHTGQQASEEHEKLNGCPCVRTDLKWNGIAGNPQVGSFDIAARRRSDHLSRVRIPGFSYWPSCECSSAACEDSAGFNGPIDPGDAIEQKKPNMNSALRNFIGDKSKGLGVGGGNCFVPNVVGERSDTVMHCKGRNKTCLKRNRRNSSGADNGAFHCKDAEDSLICPVNCGSPVTGDIAMPSYCPKALLSSAPSRFEELSYSRFDGGKRSNERTYPKSAKYLYPTGGNIKGLLQRQNIPCYCKGWPLWFPAESPVALYQHIAKCAVWGGQMGYFYGVDRPIQQRLRYMSSQRAHQRCHVPSQTESCDGGGPQSLPVHLRPSASASFPFKARQTEDTWFSSLMNDVGGSTYLASAGRNAPNKLSSVSTPTCRNSGDCKVYTPSSLIEIGDSSECITCDFPANDRFGHYTAGDGVCNMLGTLGDGKNNADSSRETGIEKHVAGEVERGTFGVEYVVDTTKGGYKEVKSYVRKTDKYGKDDSPDVCIKDMHSSENPCVFHSNERCVVLRHRAKYNSNSPSSPSWAREPSDSNTFCDDESACGRCDESMSDMILEGSVDHTKNIPHEIRKSRAKQGMESSFGLQHETGNDAFCSHAKLPSSGCCRYESTHNQDITPAEACQTNHDCLPENYSGAAECVTNCSNAGPALDEVRFFFPICNESMDYQPETQQVHCDAIGSKVCPENERHKEITLNASTYQLPSSADTSEDAASAVDDYSGTCEDSNRVIAKRFSASEQAFDNGLLFNEKFSATTSDVNIRHKTDSSFSFSFDPAKLLSGEEVESNCVTMYINASSPDSYLLDRSLLLPVLKKSKTKDLQLDSNLKASQLGSPSERTCCGDRDKIHLNKATEIPCVLRELSGGDEDNTREEQRELWHTSKENTSISVALSCKTEDGEQGQATQSSSWKICRGLFNLNSFLVCTTPVAQFTTEDDMQDKSFQMTLNNIDDASRFVCSSEDELKNSEDESKIDTGDRSDLIDQSSPIDKTVGANDDSSEQDEEGNELHNFRLSDLWESLEKPSLFGLEVPFISERSKSCTILFVPYLSALHLYPKDSFARVYLLNCGDAKPASRGEMDSDGRTYFNEDRNTRNNLEVLGISTKSEDTKRDSVVPESSAEVLTNLDHERSLHVPEALRFMEVRLSYKRRPLYQQIRCMMEGEELSHKHLKALLYAEARDLTSNSWICINWQAMQRDFSLERAPSFLVYYKLRARRIDRHEGYKCNIASDSVSEGEGAPLTLERFAVIASNADSKWLKTEHDRAEGPSFFRLEIAKVSTWLKSRKENHPDFNSFCSSCREL